MLFIYFHYHIDVVVNSKLINNTCKMVAEKHLLSRTVTFCAYELERQEMM